jgi:FkbM family methyltransferase
MSGALLSPLRKAARQLWRERRWYGRRRDWLARWYNGVINRSRGLPWPGRGGVWPVRIAGVEEPFFVRQGSKDWVALREIWFQGEYDAVVDWPLQRVGTIVDLGAHIGLTVRLWRRRFPGARVIAVEPDPDNLATARRNVAALGGDRGVEFIHAAACGEPGHVYLDRSEGNPLVYRTVARPPTAGAAEVEGLTMDQILERTIPAATVDLLKCDIEGAERELFASCAGWIGRVRHMVIEIHPDYSLRRLTDDLRAGGAESKILWQRSKPSGVEVVFLGLTPERLPGSRSVPRSGPTAETS